MSMLEVQMTQLNGNVVEYSGRLIIHPTAGSAEDMGGEQTQQPSSDSSSDSDYDVQLARKIKQRSSYQARTSIAMSVADPAHK